MSHATARLQQKAEARGVIPKTRAQLRARRGHTMLIFLTIILGQWPQR